jgi:hypothetical protein
MRLRPIVASTVTFSSDGGRFVAWQTSEKGAIIAMDTETGYRWTANTGGCELDDGPEGLPAGSGRFLVYCNHSKELLDARTGRMKPLPTTEYGPDWEAVGSRYVEGVVKLECRRSKLEIREGRPCAALYDIATGAISYRTQLAVTNLDRPGAPPICKALRTRIDENWEGYSERIFAVGGHSLGVYRCHGKPRLLPAIPKEPMDLTLSAGVVSWNTGVSAEELPDPTQGLHGALSAYTLRSGRLREFTLPQIFVAKLPEHPKPGVFGYSAHTANMVFWIATRTITPGMEGVTKGTAEVYAAKL